MKHHVEDYSKIDKPIIIQGYHNILVLPIKMQKYQVNTQNNIA